MKAQHLVVIRGNSGSGKTTLARDLQLAMGPGTANIGQDHLRRVVLREHDLPDADNIGLIAQTTRHCLAIGYHVIVEGILYSDHYRTMLYELLDGHAGPTHVFYLDISLDETLQRHAGRPLAAEIAPEQLQQWYRPRDVLDIPGEVVLDAKSRTSSDMATSSMRLPMNTASTGSSDTSIRQPPGTGSTRLRSPARRDAASR